MGRDEKNELGWKSFGLNTPQTWKNSKNGKNGKNGKNEKNGKNGKNGNPGNTGEKKDTQQTNDTNNTSTNKQENKEISAFDVELRKLAAALQVEVRPLPTTQGEDIDHNERLRFVHQLEGEVQRKRALSSTSIVDVDDLTQNNLQSGLHFGKEDSKVDRCAVIMRMLHLEEMRIMQSSINSILETAQEYVANPKTDSSLGRVGR